MYQSLVALRPETIRDTPRPGRPVVERIAGWSSRHRKTAVFGWLFMAAQTVGTKNLPSYDPGQSGQAERALHQAAPGYYGSAAEVVLIQARVPGETFAGDASMRQAARQLVTALAALPRSAAGIGSSLTLAAGHRDSRPLVSADGRSALVTFNVPGNARNQDRAVAADQRAVAAVQGRHPDLLVAETGDASVLRAIDNSLDFRQAEATSIPITLILLLVAFGAVVRTMSEIHRAFPQAPAPAEVVVTGPDATGPRVMAAVAALQGRAAAGGPIREPVTATAAGSGTEGRALVVDVPLAGHGTDSASDQAVAALRSQILSATLGKVPGISYALLGERAWYAPRWLRRPRHRDSVPSGA